MNSSAFSPCKADPGGYWVEGSTASADAGPLPPPVRDSVQSLQRSVSCVHALVQADQEVCSFEGLQYFLSYKG